MNTRRKILKVLIFEKKKKYDSIICLKLSGLLKEMRLRHPLYKRRLSEVYSLFV